MPMLAKKNVNPYLWKSLLSLGLSLSLGFGVAQAASLGVSPTMIDMTKGEKVSGLRVRNGEEDKSVRVQARLVRWTQDENGDSYESAQGVVASPPVTLVKAGAENLIRVVRTAKHPIAGEESYRLLVDELPDPAMQKEGAVSILVRHSVPVFFSNPKATAAQPDWKIERASQKSQKATLEGWRVIVNNSGDKRMRLASLILHDKEGKLVAKKEGLIGYVLGHSAASFFITPVEGASLKAKGLRVTVKLETKELETEVIPVQVSAK